jgi:hypothetical protein
MIFVSAMARLQCPEKMHKMILAAQQDRITKYGLGIK